MYWRVTQVSKSHILSIRQNFWTQYFATTFVDNNGVLPNFPAQVPPETFLSNIASSASDVAEKLNKLNADSASDPDELAPKFLEKMSHFICQCLSVIFERFFLTVMFPTVWKEAYVKPIFKTGNVHDVKNYQTISLTCVCSKIMKSVVDDQMMFYLIGNGLISKNQHGFLAKRSTCTNSLDSFQDWVIALKGRVDVDIAFVDFFLKLLIAFLTPSCYTNFKGTAYNMNYGHGSSAFWSTKRSVSLVDKCLSSRVSVRSGVVQGSVLGPLLFISFIDDALLDAPATCQLYADDRKLYSTVELGNHNSIAYSLWKLKLSVVWKLAARYWY